MLLTSRSAAPQGMPVFRRGLRGGREADIMSLIYKICPLPLWREAEKTKLFHGAPVDLADGFIHFSAAGQVAETAAKHFAGQPDLLLVAVRAEALGEALRWEVSRGGALFPHLYGPLPLSAVRSAVPLPLGADGRHVLPPEITRPSFDPRAEGWEPAPADDYLDLVGPLWQRPAAKAGEPGFRRFGFLAQKRHLNRNGMVHGGMIMTFLDHALGLTMRTVNRTNRQSTIQLDTHFLSGIEDGEFAEAHCRVTRATKSLLFAAGEVLAGGRPVAQAQAIFKIGPPFPPRTPLSAGRS